MEKFLYKDMYNLEKEHFWHISKRKTALCLVNRFLRTKNTKILDIGCGTGENIKYFTQVGKAFGVDNSKEAISFCKKRGITDVKIASATHTGYKESTFNLVMMLDVLEHIDEKSALIEAKRIMKKEGLILITVPAYQFLWSQWDVILHHKRRYTKDKLRNVLIESGFNVLCISYMFSFLLPFIYIVRLFKNLYFKSNYTSDFRLSSPLINKLFLQISRLERRFVLYGKVPFGTSIICIARKK